MTRQRNKDRKGKEKRKGQTGKDYEQVGLQEAPHLQDPKQNHSENAKSGKFQTGIFLYEAAL
jgi:hypothetical protein